MKVVMFCGGMGMRMRQLGPGAGSGDDTSDLPKPMVQIGVQRPLLWHVMKYYAHFGHKEFILCLGYRGDAIKRFFLNYNECLSNDFVMSNGGTTLDLLKTDISDWKITFVDTGLKSCIGERLMAVKPYLEDDDMFLANYSDGLSDLPLPAYIDSFKSSGKTAAFLCVRPPHSGHIVHMSGDGQVTAITGMHQGEVWINGGYFVLKKEIFDYMRPGEELVEQPFQRLIEAGQLFAYKYTGFWTCVDTFKEKQHLDTLYAGGDTPWMLWEESKQTAANEPSGAKK